MPLTSWKNSLQTAQRKVNTESILHYKFPVHIITKSDLVLRDTDLLQKINRDAILPIDLQAHLSQKASITFSFSTLDDSIARIFEPGATPPTTRLDTMKKILSSGFHSGFSLMPLIYFQIQMNNWMLCLKPVRRQMHTMFFPHP